MDARKNADGIIAEATQRANQMVSETEIMNQANQKAYETVEMARVQANDILAQAVAEANEVRLGSMQYTNDIMMGIRNYVEATMEAERANYENLIAALNNDFVIANANIAEVQNQIVEFTGDPSSVTRVPQIKTAANGKAVPTPPKAKQSVVDKVKQAVGVKEEKIEEPKQETKPAVNIPDFITSGEKVVPNDTPLQPNVDVKPQVEVKEEVKPEMPVVSNEQAATTEAPVQPQAKEPQVIEQSKQPQAPQPTAPTNGTQTKKVKKKIVKKRNPVLHTPQTAQETVAKTLEAAAAAKVDKTVYKANGEQAREVPPMEGRVKRGPRVGRGLVENQVEMQEDNGFEVETDAFHEDSMAPAKSLGVVDDFSMEEKF